MTLFLCKVAIRITSLQASFLYLFLQNPVQQVAEVVVGDNANGTTEADDNYTNADEVDDRKIHQIWWDNEVEIADKPAEADEADANKADKATDEADVDNTDLIDDADEAIVAKSANKANKTNVAKEVNKTTDSNGAKEADETKNPTIYQVDKAKDQMVTKGHEETERKAAAEGLDTAEGQVATEGKVAAKSWTRGNVVAKNWVEDKGWQC